MDVKRDKFLIVGLAKSGLAVTELLLSKGAKCYLYDDSDSSQISANCIKLEQIGAVKVEKEEIDQVINEVDVIVLSPGVPIDHDIPIKARKLKKRILGELELSSSFCKAPIVAVTGTNGKTTTCTMIDSVLKDSGFNSKLCGNIGTPLSEVVNGLDEDGIAVVETSSFQLETVSSFKPHIAVITNVTPDHLSRHYNMENYLFIKSKILMNLRESEYAILCYDDPLVMKLAEKTRAKIIYFSAKTQVDGAYVEGGKIYFKGRSVCDISELPIHGEHNLLNFLATLCVSEIFGIDSQKVVESLGHFKGVKHRIQYIATIRGVDYYNDSKATNSDATEKAIDSMGKPTVLIMGGKDKGLDFNKLFVKISKSNVKSVIVTGESRYRLLESAKTAGYDSVSMVEDFEIAIKLASLVANEGENVLLSPACSSFDRFTNFEERGDAFIRLVENLNE